MAAAGWRLPVKREAGVAGLSLMDGAPEPEGTPEPEGAARPYGTPEPDAYLEGPSLVPLGPATLTERIRKAAVSDRGVWFIGSAVGQPAARKSAGFLAGPSGPGAAALSDVPVESASWAELHEEAMSLAGTLQARGVEPGDRVAVLGSTSRQLMTVVQAVWLAGAAVAVLPLPLRLGSAEDFLEATSARLSSAAARLVLVADDLASLVDLSGRDIHVVSMSEIFLQAVVASRLDEPQVAPGDLAILQYTSGSTSAPKGVILTHAMVTAQIDAAVSAAGLDPHEDVMASWLPLYHDMGLIGFLVAPMTTGTGLVQASPQDFTADPLHWLQWMSAWRATVTAGPNFAYVLATRAFRRADGLDLSPWRIALNGAEPVEPAMMEELAAAGRPFGFDERAVFCAFGMAEATLAVTFPEPFTGMRDDVVDRSALESRQLAVPAGPGSDGSRRLARLGRPIPGISVRIVDPPTGKVVAGREVGELEIRGASVTSGYWRNEGASAGLFRDGWLRTGDLGYVADGELVVCGREKDMIIVAGRNVYPEDIERVAGTVPGVRPGNVIAFGVDGHKGREAVVVVAETRDEAIEDLQKTLEHRVRHSSGISVEEVVLVAPGTLPKTSSGKLQRALCRERYLAEELARV